MKAQLLYFLLFICTLSTAQKQNNWFLEASTGMHAGWWLYNHGTDNVDVFANQGLDYSHFSVFLPFNLAAGIDFGQTQLAIGTGYTIYFDNELRRHNNAPSILSTYLVSENYPKIFQLYAQGKQELISNLKFSFGPFARLGWFKLLADPPQEAFFKQSYFWQLGVQADFKFKKNILFLRPSYQENIILIKVPGLEDSSNKIFSIGAEMGFQLNLNKSNR